MKYDYNGAWENIYGDIQQFGPTHKHLRRIISNILKEINYESFVDVGCGPGVNFPLLLKNKSAVRMVGIDISGKSLNEAKNKYKAEFILMDIQRGYLNEKFDLVFCSLLLEHVLNDQIVLEYLHKMTGHYLLISTMGGDYTKYQKWEEKMGHVRNYSIPELENKLNRAGYKIIKFIKWGFPFYSPLGRLLQNIRPEIGVGKYSLTTKIVAKLMYWLDFLNCSNNGDLLIILAEI